MSEETTTEEVGGAGAEEALPESPVELSLPSQVVDALQVAMEALEQLRAALTPFFDEHEGDAAAAAAAAATVIGSDGTGKVDEVVGEWKKQTEAQLGSLRDYVSRIKRESEPIVEYLGTLKALFEKEEVPPQPEEPETP